jgi:hypothetical protein
LKGDLPKPLDVFARDPLPLEKIFAGARINLSPARVLVPLGVLDAPSTGPGPRGFRPRFCRRPTRFAQKDGAPTMAGAAAPTVTVALDADGRPRFHADR